MYAHQPPFSQANPSSRSPPQLRITAGNRAIRVFTTRERGSKGEPREGPLFIRAAIGIIVCFRTLPSKLVHVRQPGSYLKCPCHLRATLDHRNRSLALLTIAARCASKRWVLSRWLASTTTATHSCSHRSISSTPCSASVGPKSNGSVSSGRVEPYHLRVGELCQGALKCSVVSAIVSLDLDF